MKRLEKFAPKILAVWITLLSIFYSLLSLIRHNNFQSGAFDLGIFDQAIWQYAHFLYPYNTIKERFILGDHLTLTLPLFAPLFWVWDDVRILLVTQAVWITLSTIAIYKIARLRKFSGLVALGVSIVYSIFYGIQFGVYFDWHPVIFGVGLLVWLAYFFETKKWKLFWVTLILMLLTQENMGIGLASLGCIYFFQKQYRKKAVLFFVGGILVSLLSVYIVSKLSPVGYQYQPKIASNPITVIQQFYDIHDKQLVWLYTFSGFAFLPLLSPGSILAVILDLSQYFAAANEFGHMLTPYLHLRAILAVFVALGTLDALKLLKKWRINPLYVTLVLVLFVLMQQYAFHFPLDKLSKRIYWQSTPWMADINALLPSVPKDVPVAATQHIVPHLSHRNEIYLIWPRQKTGKEAEKLCHKETCWWLDFAGKPKYLVVDLDNTQWITQLLESPANFQMAVTNMIHAGKIKEYKRVNTAYIYTVIEK